MKQLVKTFSTIEDLAAFFSDEQTRLAMENARSVLAQVYVTARDHPWMSALLAELARLSDKVIVVGASTFGQQCDGKAMNGTNVVCMACFDLALFVLFGLLRYGVACSDAFRVRAWPGNSDRHRARPSTYSAVRAP